MPGPRSPSLLRRFEPAVTLRTRVRLLAATWVLAGTGLCAAAVHWLGDAEPSLGVPLVLAGLAAAALIARFGFGRVADRNYRRLALHAGPRCLFAFQSWTGWLTVAFMVGLGYGLRHSPLPRPWLGATYLAIGGGLIGASRRYLRPPGGGPTRRPAGRPADRPEATA